MLETDPDLLGRHLLRWEGPDVFEPPEDPHACRVGQRLERGLQLLGLQVSSWPFGDFVLGWDYDVIADGSKARRLGFHSFVDTREMFVKIFGDLRRRRIIP